MTGLAEDLDQASRTPTRWRARLRSAAVDLLPQRARVEPLERGWAWPVLAVWAAGRALNVTLLWVAYFSSRIAGWTFGPDGERAHTFLDFLSGWDAERYGAIATTGYPVSLPTDASGAVERNNWAFLPVFPLLERTVSDLTGLPWQVAGVLISVAASAAATLALFVLLRSVSDARAATWAVVLFSFGPLSFVFVLGYAESLFLVLLFSALLLAVRRRYLSIAPLGVIAAFTRPGAVALALGLGILLLLRWMLRDRDPLTRSEVIGLVVSGGATAICGVMWPVIADAVTGQAGTYVRSEMAWWVPFLGEGSFLPLAPCLVMGWTWLGPLGVALFVLLVGAVFRWILSAQVRRLGIEVVGFALSYTLYLFAVFLPTQSLARLVLPLTPLLADSRLSASARARRWSLGGSFALQAVAVYLLWALGNP